MVDIFLLPTVCILPHLADGDLLGGIFNVHLLRLVGCNEGDLRFCNAGRPHNLSNRWVILCLVCRQHQEIVGGAVADVTVGGRSLFELVEYASLDLYNIWFHLILRVPEQDLAVCICRVVTIGLTPLAAVPMGQCERCTRQGVIVLVPFHLEQLQGVGIRLRSGAAASYIIIVVIVVGFTVPEHIHLVADMELLVSQTAIAYEEAVLIRQLIVAAIRDGKRHLIDFVRSIGLHRLKGKAPQVGCCYIHPLPIIDTFLQLDALPDDLGIDLGGDRQGIVQLQLAARRGQPLLAVLVDLNGIGCGILITAWFGSLPQAEIRAFYRNIGCLFFLIFIPRCSVCISILGKIDVFPSVIVHSDAENDGNGLVLRVVRLSLVQILQLKCHLLFFALFIISSTHRKVSNALAA